MKDVFYGPWHVRVLSVDPIFKDTVKIFGSDLGASIDLLFQEPSGIEVTGSEWTLVVERAVIIQEPGLPPEESEPVARKTKRSTRFDPTDGLVVQIDTVESPHVSLFLISRDPLINPPRQPNPYDFTLPD